MGDQSTGRAVVVDPQRDIDQYLDRARELNLTITHVLETHFHADFLSGHLELAKATGATICFGAEARPQFAAHLLADGEYAINHLPDASNIPVSQLRKRLTELDPLVPTVVHCAGGYRSSIAASVLRANGFRDVSDVLGGFEAILQVQN